jgi:nickel-type superoxide dismutase maturation protease
VTALVITPLAARIRRSWPERVAVDGPSMAPNLLPGDWVLVDPAAYRDGAPRAGDLVVVPDPRPPGLMLVKRVRRVAPDGRLHVVGDDPDRSTDSRAFGRVGPGSVVGRPWLRYWPPGRWGRVR